MAGRTLARPSAGNVREGRVFRALRPGIRSPKAQERSGWRGAVKAEGRGPRTGLRLSPDWPRKAPPTTTRQHSESTPRARLRESRTSAAERPMVWPPRWADTAGAWTRKRARALFAPPPAWRPWRSSGPQSPYMVCVTEPRRAGAAPRRARTIRFPWRRSGRSHEGAPGGNSEDRVHCLVGRGRSMSMYPNPSAG